MKSLKSFVLPMAMIIGGAFYEFFDKMAVAIPYFIFTMLLLTFAKLSPRDVRPHRLHVWLLLIQLLGGAVVYAALFWIHPAIGEGAFACVFAPTAMAAAVITGMLGGSVAFLTTYVFLSSIATALTAPFFFSFIGVQVDMPFMESFLTVCGKVMPLLVLPLVMAWFFRFCIPPMHRMVLKIGSVTFYLWAVALTSITGRTVKYIVSQENPEIWVEVAMAGIGLVICLAQFKGGKYLGSLYGERIAAGQAMGQKNTILAIWLSQLYLNPIASIAPASYVLWQNIVNSYQLYRKNKREKESLQKTFAEVEKKN